MIHLLAFSCFQDARRIITALSILTLFGGCACAQIVIGPNTGLPAGPLNCNAIAAVPPTVRAEGVTELVSDIIIVCTGGAANPQIGGVPGPGPIGTANFTISLPTNVTSRPGEPLLMIDEPGSMLPGAQASQIAGTNVFAGTASANQVFFNSIPLSAPYYQGLAHVYRITNIRANATALPAGSPSSQSPLHAFVSISGSSSLALSSPQLTVGYIESGLNFQLRAPDNSGPFTPPVLAQCASPGPQRIGVLRFAEIFVSAFSPRTRAFVTDVDTAPDPASQNIPGAIYNAATGFYSPDLPGGLANFGTRLRAFFSNIPPGSKIYVSTQAVVFKDGVPALPALNTDFVARLITDEAADFQPAAATVTLDGIPAAEIPNTNGAFSVAWEVLSRTSRANSIDNADFLVWVQQGSGSATPATVTGSFAPLTATFTSSSTAPIPRFTDSFFPTSSLFTAFECQPSFTTNATLPAGTQFAVYSQQLQVSGGVGPYTYTVTTGAPPSGVTVNTSTGVISGTPQASGAFAFTVRVTDSNQLQATRAFTLQINPSVPSHPAFFTGEVALTGGVYYLQIPGNGNLFGYYNYAFLPWLYHYDLGFEYLVDAHDEHNGVYLYDDASGHWFYTSPTFPFPYLYDFTLNSLLYYYPDLHRPGHYTTGPRYFYNFAAARIITM